MDSGGLVTLVQLGFHGTALAFLVLGYRLMRQVLASDDDDSGNHHTAATLKEKLKNVRFFMVMSVVVMVLGIGAQILAQQLTAEYVVEVHLSPSALPEGIPMPEISTHGEPMPVKAPGLGQLKVGRNVPIRVVFDTLVTQINHLQDVVRTHQEVVAERSGGGFDDPQ